MDRNTGRRVRIGAGVLLAAALLDGCASLDPTENIRQSSTLVTDRAGSDTGWTLPWYEESEAWDGHVPLSSETAVRVALQNNREIRQQVETIVATRADYVQAHLLPNPVISLAVGFPTDGLGGTPLTAAVVQQLAWLWSRDTNIDAAESALRGRILAVSDDALRLVAEVRQNHARVCFAERAVELQREHVDLLERSAMLLRERFTVGEASRLDLNRVELDLRAAEVHLADRRAVLAREKRRMMERLGRAGDDVQWHSDGGALVAAARIEELGEERVMQLASAQRLDVAAANAVVVAHARQVDLEEQGRLPDVSAGVGYQQNFSNRPGVFPALQVTPKLLDDNSARIARAASELRQAEIEADRVQQAAIAEARTAWVTLRAQREVVRSYEQEIVGLAESTMSLARMSFDVGETDLTVLLDAEQKLNASRLELADRRLAVATQRIELERTAGGSLEPQPAVEATFAVNATMPVDAPPAQEASR